jgi:hypothetical protein
MYRSMCGAASEPKDINNVLENKRVVCITQDKEIVGSVTISAFRNSQSHMHVKFVLSKHRLKVRLVQVVHCEAKSFDLCSLDLANLVVGWIWGKKDMFVITAKKDNTFCYDICCFPVDISRNAWLECFKRRRVKTMIMFKQEKHLQVSVSRSKYLMLPLSECSEQQSSSGSDNVCMEAGALGMEARESRHRHSSF